MLARRAAMGRRPTRRIGQKLAHRGGFAGRKIPARLGGIDGGHWEFVIALVVSSLINVILFFRIIELAYFGSLADGEHHEHGSTERHEAPWWMLKPLVITAVLLIVVGFSTGPLINNVISLIIPAGF